MSELEKFLNEVKERADKTTNGPWVLGDWTIFDEDREAQKRREPYWTLIEGEELIAVGPIGRKSLDIDGVIRSVCYDGGALSIKKEDSEFIIHSRTDIEKLLKIVVIQSECLKFLSGSIETSNYGQDIRKAHSYDSFKSWQTIAREALSEADKIAGGL